MTTGAGLEPGGNSGADPTANPEEAGRVDPLSILPPSTTASGEPEPHSDPDISDTGTDPEDGGDT